LKNILSNIPEEQLEPFNKGLLLPVMEEFYSLQGEGKHTGEPAWFIRIGGCDVGCAWCDVKESWNPLLHPLVPLNSIIDKVIDSSAKAVVVTGGEPLNFNLNPLCEALHQKKISLFLETSGSKPLSGNWDWICLSPKKNSPPLENVFSLANELKVIIFDNEDFEWAEHNATNVNASCHLLLQPEWSVRNKMLPLIIDYILNNTKWNLSLQTHKYIGIP
jgi:7-carboxy-7-deazaguanine synthase